MKQQKKKEPWLVARSARILARYKKRSRNSVRRSWANPKNRFRGIFCCSFQSNVKPIQEYPDRVSLCRRCRGSRSWCSQGAGPVGRLDLLHLLRKKHGGGPDRKRAIPLTAFQTHPIERLGAVEESPRQFPSYRNGLRPEPDLERRLMLRRSSTHPWRPWIVTQQQEDLRQAADLAWRQGRVTAQRVMVARKVLQGQTRRAS